MMETAQAGHGAAGRDHATPRRRGEKEMTEETFQDRINRQRRREVEEADSAHARKQRELDFWWEINLARHPGPAAAQRKSGNRRLQPSRPL